MKTIDKRLQIFLRYLLNPLWKLVLGGPPFIYGWFAFIRDEFLHPEIAFKLRISGIINGVAWFWWVICGSSIWFIVTVWEATKKNGDAFSLSKTNLNAESIRQSLEKRSKFLNDINNSDVDELQKSAKDLVEFIEDLPQGKYYAKQIEKLTQFTGGGFSFNYITSKGLEKFQEQLKNSHKEYKQQLRKSRGKISTLIDEFLQTQ